jgi:hypothetical protein
VPQVAHVCAVSLKMLTKSENADKLEKADKSLKKLTKA